LASFSSQAIHFAGTVGFEFRLVLERWEPMLFQPEHQLYGLLWVLSKQYGDTLASF
jgi:hypothetical protein